jgi:carboxypeptidase C (cathepsin A)
MPMRLSTSLLSLMAVCTLPLQFDPPHLTSIRLTGTYGPHIASIIHKENKALALAPIPSLKKINLASLILANGLTDPYIQMGSVADYACEGPYPVYDDPEGAECTALRNKIPTCQRLIKSCYNFNSRFTCVPAGLYCNGQLYGPLMSKLCSLLLSTFAPLIIVSLIARRDWQKPIRCPTLL